jgi:hypothetical protein
VRSRISLRQMGMQSLLPQLERKLRIGTEEFNRPDLRTTPEEQSDPRNGSPPPASMAEV